MPLVAPTAVGIQPCLTSFLYVCRSIASYKSLNLCLQIRLGLRSELITYRNQTQRCPRTESWTRPDRCPCLFTVYGVDGEELPQIEEHPVALAMYILSPKSCVISFAYGVSPHPAHAPENSSSGCLNWLPFTVVSLNFAITSAFAGSVYCVVECLLLAAFASMFSIASAFAPFLPGQTFTQEPHPVQSRADTTMCELVIRHTGHRKSLCSFRSSSSLSLGQSYRTDNCVRADIGTSVTLDTVLRIPYRDIYCDTTLLVCSGTVTEWYRLHNP